MKLTTLLAAALHLCAAPASSNATPLASRCSAYPSSTAVVCIHRHAAVLPQPFHRDVSNQSTPRDAFRYTHTTDASFDALVPGAPFVVFNSSLARTLLGANPTYDFVFATTNTSVHEAPVWVPALQSIVYSLPRQGDFAQHLVNLSDPARPALGVFSTTPPVWAVNGGKLFNGTLYWAVEGGRPFRDPRPPHALVYQTPGIYAVDPVARTSAPLVNNYYGTPFNSPNDLWVDAAGDVFFTDSWYGYAVGVSATFPPNTPATYRFRARTGETAAVETSLEQPNGIAFSPDGRTAYLSDTGTTDFAHPPPGGAIPRYGFNRYGGNGVYAYDVQPTPDGSLLANKRSIYRPQEGEVDGLHVSREGYLVGAAGQGVDVLSPWGTYLMRVYTNFTVNNVQFAGPERDELWLFGQGGIARVRWGLKGMVQE